MNNLVACGIGLVTASFVMASLSFAVWLWIEEDDMNALPKFFLTMMIIGFDILFSALGVTMIQLYWEGVVW